MIKEPLPSYRVSLVLSLISLIIALLGISQAIQALANTSEQILFGASLLLFILAEASAMKAEKGSWTGFARLPLMIVWLVLGYQATLLIVVLGAVIAVVIHQRFDNYNGNYQAFHEGSYYIANSGTSILVIQLVYMALGGQFPILQATSPYYEFFITIPALLIGATSSLLIYTLSFPVTRDKMLKMISRDILSEVMGLVAALVIPLIFVYLGWFPFICVIALAAGQNIRRVQIERTEEELNLRVLEISTLNSFGNAVTTQISLPGVLEIVYRELSKVIETTSFFIALYDDDQNTVEYPFVIKDDKRVVWQKHKLDNSLIDYVIQEKRPIYLSKPELNSLPKEIHRQDLTDAQYMITPLTVGTKIIGAMGMSHATDASAFPKTDYELLQTIASQTSLAIRNANLYDRTVRLADNLSLINQSLQDVMFNLDRTQALKTACEIARNVTRAQKAAIFLVQPHRNQQMKRIEAIGFENLDFTEYIEYPAGIFKNGPRVVVDVGITVFDDIREQARVGKFQACLQVPLRSGNTIVGSLTVYHNEPYYYETPELNLLEMLANQITAALDNADLLQALELYAAEQAQLVHLSRISNVSLDLERIINDVSEMLAQMMDMPYIAIALNYPERDIVRIETPGEDGFGFKVRELSPSLIPELQSVLDVETVTTLSTFYSEQDKYSQGLQDFIHDNGFQTLAMLPMKINRNSLGIILMGDHKRREFSENDYRLLEMASHQISAQIHNARLYTQTQEALVQRLEQLDLIEEISQQISQALDLDLIIQNVLEAALQSTHADFVTIALIENHEQDKFEIIGYEVAGDKLQVYKTRLANNLGVTGHVAATGETLLINDNESNEMYFVPPGIQNKYRSSLALPLIKGENVVGVLNLESKQPNFFTMEQASFIKSLAGHAVISIDNAGLLKEREHQINILTRLREMALNSLNVTASDKMAMAILNTALMIFEGHEGIIYRYSAEEQSLSFICGMQLREGKFSSEKPVFPESLILKIASTAQSYVVENIQNDEMYQNFEQKEQVRHRSMVTIPIVRRQEVREILCIGFAQTREFTVEDMGTVALLAVQAAGHLENAALNEAITTSNDRMRAILDSTLDGIILLDPEGRVQDANNAAKTLTQLSLNQHLQESLSAIIEGDGKAEEFLQQLVQSYMKAPEAVHEKEYTVSREEGALHIKTFVYRVQDNAGETVGRLLVLRDVTRQKSLQDFHDRMQGMVLHDLRGPLSSIITSMYMAMNIMAYPGDDPLEDTLLPTLQVSLDSANDLLQLVETLQELPMLTEMQVNPNVIQLHELAHKARNVLTALMKEAKITVDIEIDPDETAYIDRNLVRRVFVNLLHNAVKFTPEDGRILIRVDHESNQTGYLRVQIADTGPGIPEKERERIFGEFVQIEGRKPRTGGKGMGIGLNFCKLAAEAHGGRIWVAKESPLSGACFAFTLPMTDEALNSRFLVEK